MPVSRTDQTLDGNGEITTGYITVTVVSEQGEFASPAGDLAALVMAQFPYDLELSAGAATFTKPPADQRPFKAGAP